MYLAHFCHCVSMLVLVYRGLLRAHREDTNALEAPNVLIKVLCIRSDFMPGCNRCFEDVLSRAVLEVCAVRNIDRSTVSVERLIDLWVFEVVVFELDMSV